MIDSIRNIKYGLWRKRQLHNQKAALRQWMLSMQAKDCILASSLTLRGHPQPQLYIEMGARCCVEEQVTFWLSDTEGSQPQLHLGIHVFVGRNAYIGVHEPITIGDNALIGAYSYIISGNHAFNRRDIPIQDQGFTGSPILIEEDVWIGTHAVILPGVTIGKGAIVAAGSIVNKNIPSYEIWGGTPAKFLKNRP